MLSPPLSRHPLPKSGPRPSQGDGKGQRSELWGLWLTRENDHGVPFLRQRPLRHFPEEPTCPGDEAETQDRGGAKMLGSHRRYLDPQNVGTFLGLHRASLATEVEAGHAALQLAAHMPWGSSCQTASCPRSRRGWSLPHLLSRAVLRHPLVVSAAAYP